MCVLQFPEGLEGLLQVIYYRNHLPTGAVYTSPHYSNDEQRICCVS